MSLPPDAAAKAVIAYAEWWGGIHDEECPEDDTCACSGKAINDGVTDAVNCLQQIATQRAEDAALLHEIDMWMQEECRVTLVGTLDLLRRLRRRLGGETEETTTKS